MREFAFTMSLSLLQQLVDNRGLRSRIPTLCMTRLEIKKGKVQWLPLNLLVLIENKLVGESTSLQAKSFQSFADCYLNLYTSWVTLSGADD